VLERLDTITGVARRSAEQILAELGDDMSRFPTAAHAASWTGICPGHHESAGKRKSGKTRKGNRWLRATLIECARGAVRARDSYLAAQYHRLARRRGDKKAIVAVGHSILVAAWQLLRNGGSYRDLGHDYFDRLDRDPLVRSLSHPPAGGPGRRPARSRTGTDNRIARRFRRIKGRWFKGRWFNSSPRNHQRHGVSGREGR
jgi:transposase